MSRSEIPEFVERQNVKREYRGVRWHDKDRRMTPEQYADALMPFLESVGMMDAMKDRSLSLLQTSVSGGEKDFEVLRRIDEMLERDKNPHRQSVTLTDLALKLVSRKTIIESPQKPLLHIDARVVVADSYILPFKVETFDYILERLGAIWHAADADRDDHIIAASNVRTVLKEYARVLKPGGLLVFDDRGTDPQTSPTSEMIELALRLSQNPDRDSFAAFGFGAPIRDARPHSREWFIAYPKQQHEADSTLIS